MRVSRLSIQGFKSFASRSELELGPGVTAVVGPNGSGKSNLVDAIRLVLGETSARELRGQRLEQVIFAGGDNRSPVGMADVTLVFDNEDGRLPVDDAEVAISRRVFRDGTSEFRRNGTRVRLRDLDRLLDATGLAQAGYAVIAQNDIESIIRASPAQRRHLVEEAAGVRSAQALIDDARARLGSLDEWLEGSMGRLGELLPRLDALQKEAEVAREAKALKASLQLLRGSLERAAWLEAVARSRRTERTLLQQERRLEQAEEGLELFLGRYREEHKRLEEQAGSRVAAEREGGRLALAEQQRRADQERWRERAMRAAADHAAAFAALLELESDIATAGADTASSDGVAPDPAGVERRLGQLELERDRARQGREQLRVGLQAARSARLAQEQRRAELMGSLQEQLARDRGIAARQEEIERDLVVAAEGLNQQVAAMAVARAALDGATRTAALRRSELQRALTEESEGRSSLDEAEAALTEAMSLQRAAEALRAGAAAALAGRAGSGPLASRVRAGELELRPINLLVRTADSSDTAAVEALLGPLAQAFFGEQQVARRAVDGAEAGGELVCWPAAQPVELGLPDGCRSLASALVGAPDAIAVVVGLCGPVCLARDLASAERFVSSHPGGRAALPGGLLVGRGMLGTPQSAEGLLSLTSRLEDADRSLGAAGVQLDGARARQADAARRHQQLRSVLDRTRDETAQAGGEAQRVAQEVQAAEGRHAATATALEGARRSAQKLAESRQLEQRRLQQLQAEVEPVAARLEELAAAESRLAAELGETEASFAALQQSCQAAAEELRTIEAERGAIEARRQAVAARRAQLEQRRAVALERLNHIEGEAAEALANLRTSQRETAEIQAQLVSHRQRVEQVASESDPLREIAALERSRAELTATVQTSLVAVETLRRELTEQRRETERLRQAAGSDRADENTDDPPSDPAKVALEIARLERRLQALGPVNELAPTQLELLLTRTSGLRAAHEDATSSRQLLAEVLAVLQGESGRRFDRTLALVRSEFESVWTELFGGGRATILTVPQDGALPGIDLQVQPRGKRVVPMALLSGGERALTALALVLALQKVSPSPIYVFDEVDAALDDSNIEHFADLIRRRGEESQFLVVTHSLVTMSRASMLYGVTQDGRGGSRLLSVRLSADGRAVEEAGSERGAEVAVGS